MSTDGFHKHFNDEYQKYLSRNHRFSLRSFAKFLGLAPSTTHQYLSGRYYPSPRNLDLIAHKLHWSDATTKRFKEDPAARRDVPQKLVENLERDYKHFPLNELTVKILALNKEKNVPSDPKQLAARIEVSEHQVDEVKRALELLQAQEFIECQGAFIKFKYSVKFIARETPEGSFLEFQKKAVHRLETSLVGVPKENRLVLLSTIQIDKNELSELTTDINRFAEKVRRKYSKGNEKEFYQIIVSAVPFA